MKKVLLMSAFVLALSTGGAFAQNQPTSGGLSQGNVGPGAVKDVKKDEMKKGGATTGAGTGGTSSSAPSSSGNVGPGTK